MENEIIKKEELSLTTPIEDLEQRLLQEDNLSDLNNIINLFNVNLKKKDILRASKLNDLQDKVTAQLSERIEKKADEFSNKDLLDTYKTIQDSLNKSDNSLNNIDPPNIQINNQINISDSNSLDRDSRERVKDAVNSILKSIKNPMDLSESLIEEESAQREKGDSIE